MDHCAPLVLHEALRQKPGENSVPLTLLFKSSSDLPQMLFQYAHTFQSQLFLEANAYFKIAMTAHNVFLF